MSIDIDCVVDISAKTGEGAFWDDLRQCLWWVDIPAGLVHRFDPASDENRSYALDEPVGCLAPTIKDDLLLATRSGFWRFDPETGAKTALHDPEADRPGNRFNDGTTDPKGRFWAGTMKDDGTPPSPDGAFYRLDGDLTSTKWIDGIFTTNGLAFSPDGKTLYCSDSNASVQTIWAADYDLESGQPGERRPFFDARAVAGRPDGGTVDADGCYWMAGVSGWQLVRLTPRGEIDRIVDLPVERPSKPMFGGSGLDVLYVTSIGTGLTAGTEQRQPQAGGLFAITGLGVQGLPQARFAG
ncbi:MAG: SMP-30/gluconolactonase/LRE family protein [Alphaproteobacteria bacterium]